MPPVPRTRLWTTARRGGGWRCGCSGLSSTFIPVRPDPLCCHSSLLSPRRLRSQPAQPAEAVWLCPAAGVGKQRRVVARAGRAPPRKRSVGVNDSARSLGCRTTIHFSPGCCFTTCMHFMHFICMLALSCNLAGGCVRAARGCRFSSLLLRGSAFPSIPHCEVLRCSECHCSRPAHAVYSTTADVRPACTLFVQSTGISSSCRQPLPCRPRRLMGPPCQPRHAAKRVVGGQGWSVATAAVGPWLPHLCLYLHRRIEH